MSDLKFRADVVTVDIQGEQLFFGYPDSVSFDIEFEKSTATVDYEVIINANGRGIKSMMVQILKITLTAAWYVENDELPAEEIELLKSYGGVEYMNGRIEGSFDIDTTKPLQGKTWDILNSLEFCKDGGLPIEEVEINLTQRIIEISN